MMNMQRCHVCGRRRKPAHEKRATRWCIPPKRRIVIRTLGTCPNCGMLEAHFVPPSLGETGFFICEKEKINGALSTTQAPAPVWVTTPFTDECTVVPEPGRGELMLLKTTAIDEAGNEDCGR